MANKRIINLPEKHKYTYIPVDGGFQITNGSADYVRPIYAPHMNDTKNGMRYLYYLGDRPKLVLSNADSGRTAAGMMRFAHMFLGIKKAGSSKWLDEMDNIVSRYVYGREEYDITDSSFAGMIKVVYVRSNKLDAMLVKIELPEGLQDKLVVAIGGQKGSPGGQPFGGNSAAHEFVAEDTKNTTVHLADRKFLIVDNKSAVCGTACVDLNYEIKDALMYSLGIDALCESKGKINPMVVGTTAEISKSEIYFLLTTEDSTNPYLNQYQEDAKALFDEGVAYYKALAETVKVETPNAHLNSAVTAQIVALDGSWNDPVICHGPIAWHGGQAGWRSSYGFITAGWNDQIKKNAREYMRNQQSTGRITNYPVSDNRYNMGEVLVDQLLYYWLWTGDTEFFEKEAYDFIVKHLKYQESYIKVDGANLYENWLNAWNTDNKWNNGGPGSISTAYTWRAYEMMSQIATVLKKTDDAKTYKAKADSIKTDMKKILWDKDTGVYGEFRDIFGLKRLNTAPDLSSIYTPIDVGITDGIEGYQMLRYSDYAIDSVEIDGYEFKYSSNRAPKFYSSYGLYEQEAMNNAYAYFKVGQREKGYSQYMGCVVPMYIGKGAGPGASSHRQDENLENGGHIDFADTASLYIRTTVEGIFGIKMKQAYGQVEINPGFPKEWKLAAIETKYLNYTYRYVDRKDVFEIKTQNSLKYQMKVPARSSKVLSVKVNGQALEFKVNKFVCFHTDTLQQAFIEIEYGSEEIAMISANNVGAAGLEYTVKSNGVIKKIKDPQEIIVKREEYEIAEIKVVLAEKLGHHTFFVEVEKDDMTVILPINLEIKSPVEIIETSIVSGTNPGVNLKLKNNMQKAISFSANISVKSSSVKVAYMLTSHSRSRNIFIPVKEPFDLTPGSNKIIARINGDIYEGLVEGEVVKWELETNPNHYKMVNLQGIVNQELSTLHKNTYDITHDGNEHFMLPNFYFVKDAPRTVTPSGRTWWEDRSRGKNGVPDELNLPKSGGVYMTDIGVPFDIAAGKNQANAAFVSLYNQFPNIVNIMIEESGSKLYFMLSVSTNNMQSGIENARITVNIEGGSKEILSLTNPNNIDDWFSYQQSQAHDGVCYQESESADRELYEHTSYAESGYIQKLSRKAHANILTVDLGEVKKIHSIEFECLSNEVLAGLLGITIVKG